MTVAIKKFGNANGYVYGYDQLNRIKKMDTWNSATAGALPSTWTFSTAYNERITYDPNGNIKTYVRNTNTGAQMDNLGYNYYAGTNRLQQVTDVIAAGTFATDIDNQAIATNYVYDGIGNLVKDSSESLNVVWSPYGKVLTANRLNATTNIQTQYGYDAMQNRVLKTFINVTDTTRSYYIRDAQGNTMAVYTRRRDTVVWTEQHLYGSSRLGIWESNLRLTPSVDTLKRGRILEGQKRYELTNHLGNVLVTVNDRRKGTDTNNDGFFDVYDGVEITATDFYSFGLEMTGRTFQASSYRYGFNGKENDRSSWSSTQLVQDYGNRLYNPVTGKFLSVDPIHDEYPELTPYQFASNSPMLNVDLDGLEAAAYWNTAKEFFGGVGDGLQQLSRDLAVVRPADENDPKTLKESWQQIKNIPQNIKNIPSTLRKVYSEGTLREKVKTTVALVGMVSTLKNGGPKVTGVVQNSFRATKLVSKFKLAQRALVLAALKERPYMISAVTDAKTGITYFGENRGIKSLEDVNDALKGKLPEKSKYDDYTTYNCAECDAYNNALKAGAKWEDLQDLHTQKWDNKSKSYIDVERCDNCKTTFKDKSPTSE